MRRTATYPKWLGSWAGIVLACICGCAHAGSALLSWTPPVTNTDGSSLTDLASYRISWGCGASGYPSSATIPSPSISYSVPGLPDVGTCRFVVSAVNSVGIVSAYSNEAQKLMGVALPPAQPSAGPVITWSVGPVAITVDDTVARWTGTPSNGGTAVSGSFTPANDSLLVVCINSDENPGPNTVTPSGGGWTWTERVTRGNADAIEGYASIWTAPVTTGASMTVTLTRGGEVATRRVSGKVYIVTGQHASPIGAVGEADWSTNNQTTSLTATGAGRLFGCGTEWSALGAPTSTDTEDAAHYAGEISVMSAYKSADHSSGSQSINFDAATGTPSGNVVLLEILAAAGASAASLMAPRSHMGALLQF